MNTPPASDWLINSSPHVQTEDSVRRIMLRVLIALLPAVGAALWFFGWHALRLTVACTVSCVLGEWAIRALMKRDRGIDDLSAAVTGVLLALNLFNPGWPSSVRSSPSSSPNRSMAVSAITSSIRPSRTHLPAGLLPVAMTTWLPRRLPWTDAVTTATPLGIWKTTSMPPGVAADFFTQFSLTDRWSATGPVAWAKPFAGPDRRRPTCSPPAASPHIPAP